MKGHQCSKLHSQLIWLSAHLKIKVSHEHNLIEKYPGIVGWVSLTCSHLQLFVCMSQDFSILCNQKTHRK